MMEKEIMLMKRANINHVRNSHYPDDPYWYFLCNKYGIYLEDEANIESHEYYYGAASLSHPVEWKNAHVARVMEMVRANVNNPSIVIWSLGNESGHGAVQDGMYSWVKSRDPSRPVQYEGGGANTAATDIVCPMYARVDQDQPFPAVPKWAIKRGLKIELLEQVVALLSMGEPLPDKNRDHDLSGDWVGHRECHILPDWLLIYRIEDDVLVLTLARTGSHSDLFGK
jgi:addiction module RelE/StbE family toxin